MTKLHSGLGLLFWINSTAFALYAVFLFSPTLRENALGSYLFSLIALIVAFFLTGQNTTALIEAVSRARFSLLEKFAIIPFVALFAAPLAVTLSAHIATDWLRFVPLLLAGLTSCAAAWLRPFFWEDTDPASSPPYFLPAGLLAVTLYAVLLFHLTTAYYALPDFDPYYWLQKFQTEYTEHYVTDIGLHRPLFSSLGYIFFQTGSVDLYAYFKYLLPSLALMVIAPAALVAERMRRFSDALLVFLLPGISGSFILYSFSSIPQAILNLTFLAGTYLVVYAIIAKRPVFYFLAGGTFFLSMLYHEMAVLFFLPWLVFTLFIYRRDATAFVRRNPLVTVLAIALIMSYLSPALFEMGRFLLGWIEKVLGTILHFQPNLAFPATYVNVDGNAVGWSNWSGVARYYAFYLGPLVGISLSALVWHIGRNYRHLTLPRTEHDPAERAGLGLLLLLLALFFFMAEVFPRYFNIALLPERITGFFGAAVLAFVMIALAHTKQLWPNLVSFILIGAALLNASAALYINGEKRFLITPTQISSAEWIRGSLPADRVVFTGSHWNLIRFHSQTEVAIKVEDPSFYRDIRVFETARKNLPSEHQLYRQSFAELMKRLEASRNRLSSLDPVAEEARVSAELLSNDARIHTFLDSNLSDTSKSSGSPKIYIYFAKPNTSNPYANRPYMKTQETLRTGERPVFDLYPDRFARVYSLPDDEVVIWELIQ